MEAARYEAHSLFEQGFSSGRLPQRAEKAQGSDTTMPGYNPLFVNKKAMISRFFGG